MMNFFRKYSWFFVIVIQSFIGVGAGIMLLSSLKVDTVSANTRVGELPIAGLPFNAIKSAISDYYDDITKNGALTLEIDKKPYKLAYADFDASVDIDKTIEKLEKSMPQNGLEQFFNDLGKESDFKPVFSYNSGKLNSLCEELFSPFEKASEPEHYEVSQGVLKYFQQVPGCEVDYTRLEQELKDKMFVVKENYLVDTKNTLLLSESNAGSLYKIITKAQVPIEPVVKNVQDYIQPLSGLVFGKGQEINLKSYLDFSQFSLDMEKDLLNRISTALYQSALPIDGMKVLNRKPSKHVVSYTESGLEAVIEGEGANLILKNETDRPLMLLTDFVDNNIIFYMVSTGEIKSGVLIVQKKDPVPPPVITSVNKDLGPNKTKVLSEGVPGYTATVSRLIDDERVELYHDHYLPTSMIIQTGEKPLLTSDK